MYRADRSRIVKECSRSRRAINEACKLRDRGGATIVTPGSSDAAAVLKASGDSLTRENVLKQGLLSARAEWDSVVLIYRVRSWDSAEWKSIEQPVRTTWTVTRR